MDKPALIHFVGSPTDWYAFRLSLVYATETIDFPDYRERCLVAFPDRRWLWLEKALLRGFSQQALRENQRPAGVNYLTEREAFQKLPAAFTLASHVFCPKGIIDYRGVFESTLGAHLVGSSTAVVRRVQSKLATKQALLRAGIPSPDSLIVGSADTLLLSEASALGKSVVVKPDDADNSKGLTLVKDTADAKALAAAVATARQHAADVLIEAFVPGREIRTCVVETARGFTVPAMIEYHVSARHPVRQEGDKLQLDAGGLPLAQSSYRDVAASCPARLDAPTRQRLRDRSIEAHRALGCRQFSIFDFRVSETTGEAYLIEAGLYWSFSPQSMISKMLTAAGLDFAPLARQVVTEARRNSPALRSTQ